MDRRAFLWTLAGSFLAAPLDAESQAARTPPVVAVVFSSEPAAVLVGPEPKSLYARVFVEAMRGLGWIAGRDVTILWRSAEGHPDRYAALANELVTLKVDVIVPSGTGLGLAMRQATATIPIVLVNGPTGTIQSLAHPGGNVTGVTVTGDIRLTGKRLELLKEAVPKASRVAYLYDFGTTNVVEAAARILRVTLVPILVNDPDGLQPALAVLERQQVDAMFVDSALFFRARRAQIIDFAARHRLPAIYPPDWVRDGGLMSYGVNYADLFRVAATYVDKILKGAKPGDLPIERPTKFELLINLKTAKALGLTIPPSLLARADQVIE